MANDISYQNLEKLLQEEQQLLFIELYSPSCVPCSRIGPIKEKIMSIYKNIKIFTINVEENPDLVSDYEITMIPTILFFKNKKLQDKFTGTNEKSIFKIVDKLAH
ncbi:Thioredoxin [Thelohanellus kitauei]|uniref:Thioredoxin n=1 Tax=Thelohanellus kitauei TaxID=669202 RepID=A0A0C2IL42_THEKT|nr:Thioredoxin [Thelohanellus kitauei]